MKKFNSLFFLYLIYWFPFLSTTEEILDRLQIHSLSDEPKVRLKRIDKDSMDNSNVTIESLASQLAQAKEDIAKLQANFDQAEYDLDTFLQTSNSTLNFAFAVNTAQARLYSEKNHQGLSEDYNVAENYYGVGCQNLSGLIERVKSIDTFDSCVRVFSQPDCQGHTVVFYPGSLCHEDVGRIFSDDIKSISPCFNQPYGKRYPDDLYEAIIKNEELTHDTKQDLDRLRQQVYDQQIMLEQLGLRQQYQTQLNDSIQDEWNSCGGLVPSTELSYVNLGRRSTQDENYQETCIWLLWPRSGGPAVLTLDELVSGNLTDLVGNLSLHQVSTSPIAVTVRRIDLTNVGTDTLMNDTAILLVFKSTTKGQGFTLKIRDLGQNSLNMGFRVNANFLDSESMGSPTALRTFTYPQFPGEEYLAFERRYIIIKPMINNKIQISIDYIHTEELADTLYIFKFSKEQNKFLFFRSYSGRLRRLTNVKFFGDENEPILLYFATDGSIQEMGFQISYSYRLANQTLRIDNSQSTDSSDYDEDYDAESPTSIQQPFENCGGLVPLTNFTEISYQFQPSNENDNNKTTCIWLIWANVGGGPVGLQLKEINYTSLQSPPTLSLQYGLSIESSSTIPKLLTLNETEKDETFEFSTDSFILLVFQSQNPGESFRVKLGDLSQRRWRSDENPSFMSLTCSKPVADNDEQITHYSYPNAIGMKYLDNERRFILLTPTTNSRINLSVDFVHTEPADDFLRIYKFLEDEHRFQIYASFSGHLESAVNSDYFESESNQPILLFFRSDRSGNGQGFKISYSCQNIQVSLNNSVVYTDTDTDTDSDSIEPTLNFGSCGGLIVVSNETELAYKNMGNSSVEGEDEEICIWLIQCQNDGLIGLTLLQDNYSSLNSTLSLQSGFNTLVRNSSTLSILINKEKSLGRQIIHEESLALLTFSSKTGQHFYLKLRELGKVKYPSEESRDAKIVSYNSIKVESEDWGTFSYPSDSWDNYLNQERRFIILQPAQSEQLGISIKFIDTEPNHDYLSLYKYSKTAQNFMFIYRFTGTMGTGYANSIFWGDKDQVLLAYFHSDASRTEHGFVMLYSSQVPTNDTMSNPIQTEDSNNAIITRKAVCGSLIPVEKQLDLTYTNPSTLNIEETCVFVIWAKRGGPIKVTLNQIELSNFSSAGSSQPVLSLQRRYRESISTVSQQLKIEDKGKEMIFNETTILLVFTSTGSQGFRLRLEDVSQNYFNRNWKVSANFLSQQTIISRNRDMDIFSHPHTSGRMYSSMERRHVILKSYAGYKIQISLESLNTETPRDYLNIFKFSKKENKFIFLRRYSGNLRSAPIFEGLENQPLFLYFESDASVSLRGFKVIYSYHKVGNESIFIETTIKPELTTTTFSEIFDDNSPSQPSDGRSKTDEKNKGKDSVSVDGDKSEFYNVTIMNKVLESKIEEAMERFEKTLKEKYVLTINDPEQQLKGTSEGVIVFFILMACLSLLASFSICGLAFWKHRNGQGRSSRPLFGDFMGYSRMLSGSENILLETHPGSERSDRLQ